jgi:hypothetical protein
MTRTPTEAGVPSSRETLSLVVADSVTGGPPRVGKVAFRPLAQLEECFESLVDCEGVGCDVGDVKVCCPVVFGHFGFLSIDWVLD